MLSVAKGSGLQYLPILPPPLPAQHPDTKMTQARVHASNISSEVTKLNYQQVQMFK